MEESREVGVGSTVVPFGCGGVLGGRMSGMCVWPV